MFLTLFYQLEHKIGMFVCAVHPFECRVWIVVQSLSNARLAHTHAMALIYSYIYIRIFAMYLQCGEDERVCAVAISTVVVTLGHSQNANNKKTNA